MGSDIQIKLILKQSLWQNGAGELRCKYRPMAWSEAGAEIIRNVSLLFGDRQHVKEWVLAENLKDITLIYTVPQHNLFMAEPVEN
jgi:hypothetical protein